jgi:hypothetical protein
MMTDRHQILDDTEFWTHLEYEASRWLGDADDSALRRFWIDGFIPESITNTKRGAEVEGIAWVGIGSRDQYEYRFVVSVPQKMLQGRRQTFIIDQLFLDDAEQTLQIQVGGEMNAS